MFLIFAFMMIQWKELTDFWWAELRIPSAQKAIKSHRVRSTVAVCWCGLSVKASDKCDKSITENSKPNLFFYYQYILCDAIKGLYSSPPDRLKDLLLHFKS